MGVKSQMIILAPITVAIIAGYFFVKWMREWE